MRPRSRSLARVAVVALVLLAACGDDDDDAGGGGSATTTTQVDDTTSTEAEETTTTLGEKDQVLSDYAAAVSAFSAAANPPNPDHPDLVARYSGSALASVQDRLRSWQVQGVGAINSVESHATVASVSADVAVVEDCFIDRTQLVQLATGEAGDADETVAFLTSRMERSGGSWKVVERTGREEACEPG